MPWRQVVLEDRPKLRKSGRVQLERFGVAASRVCAPLLLCKPPAVPFIYFITIIVSIIIYLFIYFIPPFLS